MTRNLISLLFGLFFLFPSLSIAQDGAPSKWEVNGYIKFLQLTTFSQGPAFPLTNNFFHHRLNLAYYPNDNWTFAVEARNRLFYGEQLKLDPTYGRTIDQPMGLFDFSVRWVDNKNILLHSIVDRAYVNYSKNNWDVRLGRQRINWGLNTVWNPNDLFNALNFLDFDYEERPGNDAIRVQYFTGIASSVEIAYSPSDSATGHIAAALGKFNAGGYDFQTLVGLYQGEIAFGGGWQGNIKGAGFQGEGTYFIPIEDFSTDSVNSFSFSASSDYLFSNGVYGLLGFLYNSNGNRGTGVLPNGGLITGQPSAKNLFPSPWAFFGSAAGNFSPLFSGNLAVIFATENKLTAVVPTFTFSIKENWDLNLIGQSFFLQNPLDKQFVHAASSVFIRVKWSY